MNKHAIFEAIFARRSIRKFTDEPVGDAQIEEMLKAAMAAPSATNAQPWRFLVVQDAAKLADIRKILPFGKIKAPLAISVCADMSIFKRPIVDRFWVQDCSAATQNILLAAVGMGLGAVWCGVRTGADVSRYLKETLSFPKSVVPIALAAIGYPAEERKAQDRLDPSRIHYEKW